jgi:hypothetical protein
MAVQDAVLGVFAGMSFARFRRFWAENFRAIRGHRTVVSRSWFETHTPMLIVTAKAVEALPKLSVVMQRNYPTP